MKTEQYNLEFFYGASDIYIIFVIIDKGDSLLAVQIRVWLVNDTSIAAFMFSYSVLESRGINNKFMYQSKLGKNELP